MISNSNTVILFDSPNALHLIIFNLTDLLCSEYWFSWPEVKWVTYDPSQPPSHGLSLIPVTILYNSSSWNLFQSGFTYHTCSVYFQIWAINARNETSQLFLINHASDWPILLFLSSYWWQWQEKNNQPLRVKNKSFIIGNIFNHICTIVHNLTALYCSIKAGYTTKDHMYISMSLHNFRIQEYIISHVVTFQALLHRLAWRKQCKLRFFLT